MSDYLTSNPFFQCVAMNRSLTNVLFGGISAPAQSDYKIEGTITKTTVDDTVEALSNADSVILVFHLCSMSTSLLANEDASNRSLDMVWLWQKHSMLSRI